MPRTPVAGTAGTDGMAGTTSMCTGEYFGLKTFKFGKLFKESLGIDYFG